MIEFSEKQLWRDRINSTVKEYTQYLRYILNGHLVLVLVFLLGAGAYYYQEWLKSIPSGFPVAWIMAILLSLLVTKSPIYTFLKDADRIFLIPVETRMKKYFLNCLLLSFIFQVYLLLMGLGLLMPLYARVNDGQFDSFWYFFLLLSIAKGINILIRWHVQHYVNTSHHIADSLIRFCINFVILFLLFSNASPLFVVAVLVILALLFFYYKKATNKLGIKWEFLIAQDEKRMAGFYQLANMFTDVPHLRNRIKRRKLLDIFVNRIGYSNYYFSSVLRCARCGSSMSGHKGSKGVKTYRCSGKKAGKKCTSHIIKEDNLVLTVLNSLEKITKQIIGDTNQNNISQQKITELETELKLIQKLMKKQKVMFENDVISINELIAKTENLRHQEKQLTEEIFKYQKANNTNTEEIKFIMENIHSLWNDANDFERKQIISTIFNQLVIDTNDEYKRGTGASRNIIIVSAK